ncbi:hypothetical protein [Nocardia iowensis]|uniref:Uncharacterized protein n=1 Tax=Nocardia iowensis TaxID=204891 RepID=A0ABX8RSG8_NOCIO|nr:hypothetical protein [Nocardia iowensis]QXN92583.1 hypothetical protein KV110_05420 [Nocardia iowensis]
MRADRGYDAIAREVESRLIPRYREALSAALETHNQLQARRAAVVSELQEILEAEISDVSSTTARFGKHRKGVFNVFETGEVLVSVRVPSADAVSVARHLKELESLWV